MTEYAYDPDLPFVAVGTTTGKIHARFRYSADAKSFGRGMCEVIDTTPKPKIPEDAQFITWGQGKVAYSLLDGLWYGWNDAGISTQDLLTWIGDAEVTVLVPKEES